MQRISITNPQNIIDGTAKKYYFKLRNTGGPKGDKGEKGDTGATGPQGPQGDPCTVVVNSTATLEPGSNAYVTNTGSLSNAVLDFGIPKGDRGPQGAKGDKGDTGAQGETGPRGPQGERGTNATVSIGTTYTLNPGSQATVYNSGSDSNAVLNFGIPKGAKGDTGSQGPQGPQGPAGQNFAPTIVAELPATGDEGKLYLTPKAHTTSTATGNPIEATVTEQAGQLESFQLDGDTFQQTYTGKNLCGGTLAQLKNMNKSGTWNGNQYFQSGITWTVYENADGTIDRIEASGQATENGKTFYIIIFDRQQFEEQLGSEDTYTLSGCPQGGDSGYYIRVASNPWKVMLTDRGSAATGTLVPADNYTRVFAVLCVDIPAGQVNNLVFRPQLELGSTATSYEPYVGGTPSPNPDYPQPIQTVTGDQTVTINSTAYPISLGNIELCKLGTYHDYIYKDGDDWKIHKEIGEVTLDGSEAWTKAPANSGYRFWTSKATDIKTSIDAVLKANRLGVAQGDTWEYYGISGSYSTNPMRLFIRDAMFNDMTVEQLRGWLAKHNIIAYYALATPTDTTITDQTLIAQLEAVRTASLENGTNTITNSTPAPNLAGDMEIGYYEFDPTNRYDKWLWLDLNNNYEKLGS